MTEEQPESLLPVPNPDEKANIESDVEEKSPIEHYEEALTVPQIITQFNVMIMENQMPFNIFRGHKSSSSNANSDPMSPHHVVNCQEKTSGVSFSSFDSPFNVGLDEKLGEILARGSSTRLSDTEDGDGDDIYGLVPPSSSVEESKVDAPEQKGPEKKVAEKKAPVKVRRCLDQTSLMKKFSMVTMYRKESSLNFFNPKDFKVTLPLQRKMEGNEICNEAIC